MATHSRTHTWENPRGQRSLVGYSPWGCKEMDTTEQLTLYFFFPSMCVGDTWGQEHFQQLPSSVNDLPPTALDFHFMLLWWLRQ